PATLTLNPLRGQQRSRSKTAAVTRGVRELDRIRRAVESDRMYPRNRAGSRRRDVDRPIVSRSGHRVTQKQRRTGRGITLGRMVRLMNPGAVVRVLAHKTRG